MRIVALKKVYYPAGNGVEYEPGDTFEALTDADAQILVACGVAEYPKKAPKANKTLSLKPAAAEPVEEKPSDKVEAEKSIAAKAMTADEPAERTLSTAAGTYNRRDMRASED